MAAIIIALIMGFNVYPASGFVTDMNVPENTVTVTDATGHEWAFEGTEDWFIGDGVSMILSDNGTEIVTDDTILSVRYNGLDK